MMAIFMDLSKYDITLENTFCGNDGPIMLEDIDHVEVITIFLKKPIEYIVDSNGITDVCCSNEFRISLVKQAWHASDAYVLFKEKNN